MSAPGLPTFDQLRIFLTVVEEGSFAAAGRRLNRATSVISYGIANLELQLGVELFEREGTRRPRLTDAGRAILGEAGTVAQGMDRLRAAVKSLLDGIEAEVHLAVDVLFPSGRLADVLRAFTQSYPTVALHLHTEAMGAVVEHVLHRRAIIGVGGALTEEHKEIERMAAGSVPLVPVAAPDHPLAQQPATPDAARNHLQLVLTDRSNLTAGRDFSVVSAQIWRLADIGVRHALLLEGIGWANMPLPMVQADITAGRLVRLQLPDQQPVQYDFYAMWRRDLPPGPAACWLVERLIEASASFQKS